jgi:hypothetical protein
LLALELLDALDPPDLPEHEPEQIAANQSARKRKFVGVWFYRAQWCTISELFLFTFTALLPPWLLPIPTL